MNTTQRGKLIVLYGINNLGKTTQAQLLVEKLQNAGYKTEYLKYALYDLAPSGPILNNYLRDGNIYELSPREAQIIQCLNRTQFEPILKQKLEYGINIVAEDYIGTGIAWGMGAGVGENFLEYINGHLLQEDLAILIDGQRFTGAIEKKHKHEENNNLTEKVRLIHIYLAKKNQWKIIKANQPIEVIHRQIWQEVEKLLSLPHINHDFHLKVKKLTPDAKLPTRAHEDDAGLDLYATADYILPAGKRQMLNIDIAMAIPRGHVGLIKDKSGMAAQGLHILGGVIDSNYRGEIKVIVINLSNDIIHISKGQKITQMLIQKVETPRVLEVDDLDETLRGEGRFGSTGRF